VCLKMVKVLCLVALFAISAMVAYGIDEKCQAVLFDPSTKQTYYYDLSLLHHNDQTYIDSLWYRTDDNIIFYVNFCGQTASPCQNDTSVCVRIPDGDDYKYVSGGSTSTQTISLSDRNDYPSPNTVMVTYTNGVQCGPGTYTTKLYVTCVPDATPGFFYDFEQKGDCEGSLFMYSAAACGASPQSSSSAASSSASPGKCEATVTDGGKTYHYDLNALHHDDSVFIDSLWYRTSENDIFYVNFCGRTASACDDPDTSVCYRVPDGNDFKYLNHGSTSTQAFSVTKGKPAGKSVTVTYSDGDKCSSGKMKTNLVVECQPSATPGFFYDMDTISDCEVTLYMYSASGCSDRSW